MMKSTSSSSRCRSPTAGSQPPHLTSCGLDDSFESFASWNNDTPTASEHSFSRDNEFSQHHDIRQPKEDAALSAIGPLELHYESSFASVAAMSVLETPSGGDEACWPFSKRFKSKIPTTAASTTTSPSSFSKDFTHLSTIWLDQSSSSSSVSTSMTCSTAVASANSSDWFELPNGASYHVDQDGTIVVMAYPVPDPLYAPTSATETYGQCQSSITTNHLHRAPSLDPPATFKSRKVAIVDFSLFSEDDFNCSSDSNDESVAGPCGPEQVTDNNHRPKMSPSLSFPSNRPDKYKRRKDNGRTALGNLSDSFRKTGADSMEITASSSSEVTPPSEKKEDNPISSIKEEEDESLDEQEVLNYVPQRLQQAKWSSNSSGFDHCFEKNDPKPRQGRVTPRTFEKRGTTSTLQSKLDVSRYMTLQRDIAYRHAMSAGYLWQSLVGQHVRFPRTWWNGARGPEMGMEAEPSCCWMYIARHRVVKHPFLNKIVPQRNSPGQLLLHIVVQDMVTWKPIQDIVIGCFHSNARGVRTTTHALPVNKKCQEVWMAVRKRCNELSTVDCLLTDGEKLEHCARQSPLMGSRHQVSNVNLNAIFGDEPPKRTLFISETDLFTRLTETAEQSPHQPPALLLLKQSFSCPVDI